MNSKKHTSPIKEIPFNDKRKTHQQDALKRKKRLTPCWRVPALMRWIQRERMSLFLFAAMEQD
jgi:hypothetical protein